MLTLDLANLSENELADAIAQHCAAFGTLKSVSVHKPASESGYAVALITMSTNYESRKLQALLGDAIFGSTVIVRLEQDSRPIPASLKLLADTDLNVNMYNLRSCRSHLPAEQAADIADAGQRLPLEVLLVEDDPADVRMTREALRAADIPCHLHVVENGIDAVSFLCNTRQFGDAPKPDIVLLDLNLPKFGGHEVLGEIKSNELLKHIPVVVLTCSKSMNDLRESYMMNADRFMTKAMGLDAYTEQIKSIVALAMH